VLIMVNISACLLKAKSWQEAKYATSKVLELRPDCVKALYRKAQAHIGLDTSTDLDIAHDLLKRCAALEPRNAEVRAALKECSGARSVQVKKDSATFGKMFERGDIVADKEVEEAQARQAAKEHHLAQFTDEEVAAARSLGLTVESPAFLNHKDEIMEKVREVKRREDEEIAKQMGINLDDPLVKAELKRLEEEAKSNPASKDLLKPSAKRRSKASMWAKVQTAVTSRPSLVRWTLRVLYAAIAINLVWSIYTIVTAPRSTGTTSSGQNDEF